MPKREAYKWTEIKPEGPIPLERNAHSAVCIGDSTMLVFSGQCHGLGWPFGAPFAQHSFLQTLASGEEHGVELSGARRSVPPELQLSTEFPSLDFVF